MPLSQIDRYVFVCEAHISTFRHSFPPDSLENLLQEVMKQHKNLAPVLTDLGKCITRLRDIKKYGKDYYALLIGMSHEDIADNINENKTTGKLRELKRQPNESPALSAHILISKNETENSSASYTMIIENVRGLSLTNIERFLSHTFKTCFEEDRVDPITKKTKKYYPIIEITGHQSKTIAGILSGSGRLEGMVFSKTKVSSDGVGESAYPVRETSEVELKMQETRNGAGAIQWIKRMTAKFKANHFSKAKVRIIDESGRTKTSVLDMSKEDITQNFFISQEHLTGFAAPLKPCSESINDEMIGKMQAIMPAGK